MKKYLEDQDEFLEKLRTSRRIWVSYTCIDFICYIIINKFMRKQSLQVSFKKTFAQRRKTEITPLYLINPINF
jgi:hypothetical protein